MNKIIINWKLKKKGTTWSTEEDCLINFVLFIIVMRNNKKKKKIFKKL